MKKLRLDGNIFICYGYPFFFFFFAKGKHGKEGWDGKT